MKHPFFPMGSLPWPAIHGMSMKPLIRRDALDVVYEADQKRVRNAVDHTISNGMVLDVFYRILHKDGRLVWIHMSGRRMGPLDEDPRIYLVITGMSAEDTAVPDNCQ